MLSAERSENTRTAWAPPYSEDIRKGSSSRHLLLAFNSEVQPLSHSATAGGDCRGTIEFGEARYPVIR
jgi:hypothetical protein